MPSDYALIHLPIYSQTEMDVCSSDPALGSRTGKWVRRGRENSQRKSFSSGDTQPEPGLEGALWGFCPSPALIPPMTLGNHSSSLGTVTPYCHDSHLTSPQNIFPLLFQNGFEFSTVLRITLKDLSQPAPPPSCCISY